MATHRTPTDLVLAGWHIRTTAPDEKCTEFGGQKLDQAKRLKELERANQRVCKAVVDLAFDKLIQQEAARGTF